MSTIVDMVLKDSGIVPLKVLPDKSITFKSAKSPMFSGIVPTCARERSERGREACIRRRTRDKEEEIV